MRNKLNIKKLGVELDFTPPEPPKRHGFSESFKYLRKVFPFFRPYAKHYLVQTGYSFISSAFGLILPFAPKIILDDGVANGNMGIIIGVLSFTFWTSVVSMVISWFTSQYGDYLSSFVSYKAQIEYLNKLTKLDEEYFETQRSGDIISRANGLESGISYIASSITTLVNMVVRIITIPTAIAIMDWRFAVIGFPVLAITSISWYFVQRLLRSYQKARADEGGKLSSSLYDIVSSLSDLRMSGVTKSALYGYRKEYVKVWKMRVVASLVSSVYGISQNLFLAVVSLFVSIFGWSQVVSGVWTLGKAMTITVAFGYITAPFQTIYSLWDSLLGTSISIQRFFEVYEAKEIERKGKAILKEEQCEISCSNVNFSYSNGKTILKGVNLTVKPGQVVAITGDSGCGKTTFMKCIAGLLTTSSGEVLISGVPIKEVDWNNLRSRITFMSQQPYFISAPLEENILFGKKTSQDMNDIIGLCKLDIVKERLGSENIGERARGLSAGERQRVALARALANIRPIMLLDEPLSQVDIPTVRDIFKQILPRLRETSCIIVSHNPYLLSMADKVYFMYDGKLFEGFGQADGV